MDPSLKYTSWPGFVWISTFRKHTFCFFLVHPEICPSWFISENLPIGSMYAIFGSIYHQYTPNVSIYTIHGSYVLGIQPEFIQFSGLSRCNRWSRRYYRHCWARRNPRWSWKIFGGTFYHGKNHVVLPAKHDDLTWFNMLNHVIQHVLTWINHI